MDCNNALSGCRARAIPHIEGVSPKPPNKRVLGLAAESMNCQLSYQLGNLNNFIALVRPILKRTFSTLVPEEDIRERITM
jgi:hypothetical protein